MTCTISKVGRDATEYTSMYPWMPMKCFEFSMLYSSCPSRASAKVSLSAQHSLFTVALWRAHDGGCGKLTCPAVSTISVVKSCPLYRMFFVNVFSIVG